MSNKTNNNKQLKNKQIHLNKLNKNKKMKKKLKNNINLTLKIVLNKIQMLKIRNFNYQAMDQCGVYF